MQLVLDSDANEFHLTPGPHHQPAINLTVPKEYTNNVINYPSVAGDYSCYAYLSKTNFPWLEPRTVNQKERGDFFWNEGQYYNPLTFGINGLCQRSLSILTHRIGLDNTLRGARVNNFDTPILTNRTNTDINVGSYIICYHPVYASLVYPRVNPAQSCAIKLVDPQLCHLPYPRPDISNKNVSVL